MMQFRSIAAPFTLVLALILVFSLGAQAQTPENLVRSAVGSSSSDWNADFGPSKANDGDLTTRWNSAAGDRDGSWLAYTWSTPQTFNNVVVREALGRMRLFHIEIMEAGDWRSVYQSPYPANPAGEPNPIFTILLSQPVTTTGIRLFVEETIEVPSIFEIEAYNQPLGTLRGAVTSTEGAGIAGALVSAGDTRTTTDAQGNFQMLVGAGTYDVVASKPGEFRARTTRAVTVGADATVTLDFSLTALPPNLARTAEASSSSDWSEDYDAPKANDGNYQTRWNSASESADAWLMLEWSQPQTFNKVVIREALGRIQDFSLEILSGGNFNEVRRITAPATGGDPVFTIMLSPAVTTTALRIWVNEATAVPSIWEVEVTNAAVGTLSGVARDIATDAPIAGASIVVDPGGTVATTDSSGAFTAMLEPDEYLVHAAATGYLSSATQTVVVTADTPGTAVLLLPAVGENLALRATPSASTDDDFNTPDQVNDGDTTTAWMSDPEETKMQWIALTWNADTTFRMVALRSFRGYIEKSRLEILDASGEWQPIPDTEFNPVFTGLGGRTFLFDDPITTRAIRYFIYHTNHDTNVPGLSEFEVYNPPAIAPPPPPVLKGDINGDGVVNIADATIALRIAVGLQQATPEQLAAGDLDGSGSISIAEVTLILRAAVGLGTL
jgi:hypothetical protein